MVCKGKFKMSTEVLQTPFLNEEYVANYLKNVPKRNYHSAISNFYDLYNSLKKQIRDYDRKYNFENKLNIQINQRTTRLENNLPVLQINNLVFTNVWNTNMIRIAGDIWNLLHEHGDILPFINLANTNNTSWIYTCEYLNCPITYIQSHLLKWKDATNQYNYSILFELFDKIIKYELDDAITMIILDYRNGMVQSLESTIKYINMYINL